MTPAPLGPAQTAPRNPTRQARKCGPLAIALSMTLLSAGACATGSDPRPVPPRADFCKTYDPVPTYDATPEPVQRVNDRNNAAWLALGCDQVKPKE